MKNDKRPRDAENKVVRVTKTCTVRLVGNDGTSLPAGEYTLTEIHPGPTIDDFADAAFKACRSSFARLMTPQYRLVVTDGDREQGYGLERWIKLVDGEAEQKRRLEGKGSKLTIRKTAKV